MSTCIFEQRHDILHNRGFLAFTFHFHALEKEMATHSSVLAWRIPGTGEPGGLPSMGSHRFGHDWSDLAAAAVACLFILVLLYQLYTVFLRCKLQQIQLNITHLHFWICLSCTAGAQIELHDALQCHLMIWACLLNKQATYMFCTSNPLCPALSIVHSM